MIIIVWPSSDRKGGMCAESRNRKLTNVHHVGKQSHFERISWPLLAPLLLFHNSEVRIVPEFAPMLIQAAKQRMSQGQKYGWSLAGLFCHDDQYNLFPLTLNNPNKPRLSWGSTYIWDYLGVFNIRGMGSVEEPE
jgi:hypothetical protein